MVGIVVNTSTILNQLGLNPINPNCWLMCHIILMLESCTDLITPCVKAWRYVRHMFAIAPAPKKLARRA